MKVTKFKEILNHSKHIDHHEEYEVRRYKNNGGYIIIDALGDFVILEENKASKVCEIIFSDLINNKLVVIN